MATGYLAERHGCRERGRHTAFCLPLVCATKVRCACGMDAGYLPKRVDETQMKFIGKGMHVRQTMSVCEVHTKNYCDSRSKHHEHIQ